MSNRGAPQDPEQSTSGTAGPRKRGGVNRTQAVPAGGRPRGTNSGSESEVFQPVIEPVSTADSQPLDTAVQETGVAVSPVSLWQRLFWKAVLGRRRGGSQTQATRRASLLLQIASRKDHSLGSLIRPSLGDEWVIVREAACRAVSLIGDRGAVPDLALLLRQDENVAVRHSAAISLCRLKAIEELPSLMGFVLANPKHSLSCTEGMVQFGREAVPMLCTIIADTATPVATLRLACDLLCRLADPRTIRPLLALVSHPSETVRESAIRAVSQFRDTKIETSLLQALSREASVGVVVAILKGLSLAATSFDPSAVRPLLRHPAPECRAAACQLLGKSGDGRQASGLMHCLKDSDSDVRRDAALALGQLLHVPAVPQLIEMVSDSVEQVRASSVRALGFIADPRALSTLCASLRDPSESVRIAAADSLGILGDRRAVQPLCDAILDEPMVDVQIARIHALGQLADSSCLSTLSQLLHRPAQVKTQAIVALGQVGSEESVDLLLPLLRDSQAIIRYHAVLALGNLGDARAIVPVARLISDSDTLVLRGVVTALRQFNTAQAKALRAQAEATLKSNVNHARELPTVTPASHGVRRRRPLVSTSVVAALLTATGLMLGSGLLLTRKGADIPQGVANGTPLAFSRGDIAGLGGFQSGTELLLITTGGWLERWDPGKGTLVSRNSRRIEVGSHARFSKDGTVFATVIGQQLKVLDSATGEERASLRVSDTVRWFHLNEQGDGVAVWESDHGLTYWDLRTSTAKWQIEADRRAPWRKVAVSSDSQAVGLATVGGEVQVLSPDNNRRTLRLKPSIDQISLLDFRPDGRILVAADSRGEVVLLDPAGNRVIEQFATGVNELGVIGWTDDGSYLMGVGSEAAFCWDSRGGILRQAPADSTQARSMFIPEHLWLAPDGKYLASASPQGRNVRLWKVPELRPHPPLIPK